MKTKLREFFKAIREIVSHPNGGNFLLLVFIVLAGLGFMTIAPFVPEKPVKIERTEIVSIERQVGLSGRFVLASGFINSTQYFYFYEKVGNGLVLKSIESSSVIIEQSSETPAFLECDKSDGCPFEGGYTRKLTVPEGTVTEEFKGI